MRDPYDIVIIGGGPGGYVGAIRAAQLGARVALVEKDRLGGTCLNRGCIPSKAMVHDAEVYRKATSGAYCVDAEGGFRVNYTRLVQRRRRVVDEVVEGVVRLMGLYGIEVIAGRGRIVRPGLVEVRGEGSAEEIAARALVIATGSVPARVSVPGADLPGVMTSDELFEMETLPESMVIVGASVLGMEFACIYQALGTRVSVLDSEFFLKDAEQQLATRLRVLLSRRGISITIGLELLDVVRTDDGMLRANYRRKGKLAHAEGEVVLVAAGRWPHSGGLGLERLGVEKKGRSIVVDQYFRTNVPGIYAIGDCIGGHMLAHVASYEGEVAVENILGKERAADYRVVPNCFFTMPEIADVGLTEAQAREAGLKFKVSRFPFGASGRAMAAGESEGQVRMICREEHDGRGGEVLGVHIMGAHASDLIAEAAVAMRMGAAAEDIAHTIHQHPTMSEALREAAAGQLDGAIHYRHR